MQSLGHALEQLLKLVRLSFRRRIYSRTEIKPLAQRKTEKKFDCNQ